MKPLQQTNLTYSKINTVMKVFINKANTWQIMS